MRLGIIELLICIVAIALVITLLFKKKCNHNTSHSISGEKKINETEIRMRCNVCGNIFCYTENEYKNNETKKKVAAVGSLVSGFHSGAGNQNNAFETRKLTNNIQNQIKDYSKCPKCNSSDLNRIK